MIFADIFNQTDFKNQIAVKKAELNILETANKPDKSLIDKKIDELTSQGVTDLTAEMQAKEKINGIYREQLKEMKGRRREFDKRHRRFFNPDGTEKIKTLDDFLNYFERQI